MRPEDRKGKPRETERTGDITEREEFRKAPHQVVRCAYMGQIPNNIPKTLRSELQDRSLPRFQLGVGWCAYRTQITKALKT